MGIYLKLRQISEIEFNIQETHGFLLDKSHEQAIGFQLWPSQYMIKQFDYITRKLWTWDPDQTHWREAAPNSNTNSPAPTFGIRAIMFQKKLKLLLWSPMITHPDVEICPADATKLLTQRHTLHRPPIMPLIGSGTKAQVARPETTSPESNHSEWKRVAEMIFSHVFRWFYTSSHDKKRCFCGPTKFRACTVPRFTLQTEELDSIGAVGPHFGGPTNPLQP